MMLEPAATEMFETARAEYLALGKPVPPHIMEQVASISIAASLKRMADMLDGTTMGICCNETIFNPQTVQIREVRNHY